MKKVVLITGGSDGIGLATAKAYYTQGDQVIIVARNQEKLDGVVKEWPEMAMFTGDMTDPAMVKKVFSQTVKVFGRIDVVVHCSHKFNGKLMNDLTDTDVEEAQAMLGMTLNVTKAAVQQMNKQATGGRVILLGSRASLRHDVLPGSAVYAAVKGAMVHIAKSVNQEAGSDKVRVVVLCPGSVNTGMGHQAAAERGVTMAHHDMLQPEEVAAKILQLEVEAAPDQPEVWLIDKQLGFKPVED